MDHMSPPYTYTIPVSHIKLVLGMTIILSLDWVDSHPRLDRPDNHLRLRYT